MLLGQVTGKVWATKKAPGLTGQAFLTVSVGAEMLVCADCVGAGEGERVLVATGGAARGAASLWTPPSWVSSTRRGRGPRRPYSGYERKAKGDDLCPSTRSSSI